jgi:trk system potassium uptake protein TrkA
MKIIIVGCGKIGRSMIQSLTAEGHDVVAVDNDSAVLNDISNTYDIMGVCGNAVDNDTLNESGAQSADVIVSTTDSDEMNMLTCFLARKLGTKHAVARIRNPEYNDQGLGFLRQNLNLSITLNPELLVAEEIANILQLPSAVKIERFSRRNIEMIEIIIPKDSPLDGMNLIKMRTKYEANYLICTVKRGDDVFIPDGDFAFEERDIISIVTTPRTAITFFKKIGVDTEAARSVMILGADQAAYYLADLLDGSGMDVKVVDKDYDTCVRFANEFEYATVINADPADKDVLFEEGVSRADALVAFTDNDEDNILLSLFGKNAGNKKVITRIERVDYDGIIDNFDIDSIVYPKNTTSDIVTRYVRGMMGSRGGNMDALYNLIPGVVEVYEFKITEASALVGTALMQLNGKLKSGVLIAAIRRGGSIILPRGGDSILVGDSVIVVAKELSLKHITDILKR